MDVRPPAVVGPDEVVGVALAEHVRAVARYPVGRRPLDRPFTPQREVHHSRMVELPSHVVTRTQAAAARTRSVPPAASGSASHGQVVEEDDDGSGVTGPGVGTQLPGVARVADRAAADQDRHAVEHVA